MPVFMNKLNCERIGLFCLLCTVREALIYCLGCEMHLLHHYVFMSPAKQVNYSLAISYVPYSYDNNYTNKRTY